MKSKNLFKKLSVLTLVFVMIFALAACDNGTTDEEISIKSVQEITQEVEYGTAGTDVISMLPATVEVTLSNDEVKNPDVVWETPDDYDSETADNYTFTGSFTVEGLTGTAEAEVTVLDEVKDLTVESVSAIDATTISVKFEEFNNAVVVTLDEALSDGDNTVTFTYEDVEYTATVSYEDPDVTAAEEVDALIAALPAVDELTLSDKSDVTAARDAYEDLTAAQKDLVENLADLEAAETKIVELEEQASDEEAAAAVEAEIAALPAEVTLADEADVEAARANYDALTAAQQALVTNLDVLEDAEAAIESLKYEDANQTDVETKVKEANGMDSLDAVTDKLTLPRSMEIGDTVYTVSWTSSNTDVIDNDGNVTRPASTDGDAVVTLTATLNFASALEGEAVQKSFSVDVTVSAKAAVTDVATVIEDQEVELGTAVDGAIDKLPVEVEVNLSKGDAITVPVTWSSDTYDADTTGVYEFAGALDISAFSADVDNPDAVEAAASVEVAELVLSVDALPEYSTEETVEVTGSVNRDAVVMVGGEEATVAGDLTFSHTVTLAETGDNTIEVTSSDNALDLTDSASVSTYYDPDAPEATLETESPTKDTLVDIEAIVTDELSGVVADSIVLKVNDKTRTASKTAVENGYSVTYDGGNLAEGTYTVSVVAEDAAGNALDTQVGEVVVDRTAPQGTSLVINGGDATTENDEVELGLAATDDLDVEMMVSNSEDFAGATWEDFSATKTWNLTAEDGVKTVYAKFKDEAGNVSAVVSDSIELIMLDLVIDPVDDVVLQDGKDAQDVTLTAELDGTDVSADTTFTAESSDTAVATVAVDGSTLTVTPVAQGTATVTVNATKGSYVAAPKTFAVDVNTFEGADELEDQVIGRGTETTLTLSALFNGEVEDAATFTAVSADESVATATVEGSELTLAGVAGGTTEVTVTSTYTGAIEYTSSQTFSVEVTVPLDVAVEGNGSVTVDPEKDFYSVGEEVTLTATADADYTFKEWTGDLVSTEATEVINVAEDMSITAVFTDTKLTVEHTGEGLGTTTPAEGVHTYVSGTEVSLTATPDANYAFDRWIIGSTEYTTAEKTITLNEDTVAQAKFVYADNSLVLESDDEVPQGGDPVTFTATLTDPNGDPIVGEDVSFEIVGDVAEGTVLSAASDTTGESGQAAVDLTLGENQSAGAIEVKATWLNLETTDSVNVTQVLDTLSITKPADYETLTGTSFDLELLLSDKAGDPYSAQKDLTITFTNTAEDVVQEVTKTDVQFGEDGKATLNVNEDAGSDIELDSFSVVDLGTINVVSGDLTAEVTNLNPVYTVEFDWETALAEVEQNSVNTIPVVVEYNDTPLENETVTFEITEPADLTDVDMELRKDGVTGDTLDVDTDADGKASVDLYVGAVSADPGYIDITASISEGANASTPDGDRIDVLQTVNEVAITSPEKGQDIVDPFNLTLDVDDYADEAYTSVTDVTVTLENLETGVTDEYTLTDWDFTADGDTITIGTDPDLTDEVAENDIDINADTANDENDITSVDDIHKITVEIAPVEPVSVEYLNADYSVTAESTDLLQSETTNITVSLDVGETGVSNEEVTLEVVNADSENTVLTDETVTVQNGEATTTLTIGDDEVSSSDIKVKAHWGYYSSDGTGNAVETAVIDVSQAMKELTITSPEKWDDQANTVIDLSATDLADVAFAETVDVTLIFRDTDNDVTVTTTENDVVFAGGTISTSLGLLDAYDLTPGEVDEIEVQIPTANDGVVTASVNRLNLDVSLSLDNEATVDQGSTVDFTATIASDDLDKVVGQTVTFEITAPEAINIAEGTTITSDPVTVQKVLVSEDPDTYEAQAVATLQVSEDQRAYEFSIKATWADGEQEVDTATSTVDVVQTADAFTVDSPVDFDDFTGSISIVDAVDKAGDTIITAKDVDVTLYKGLGTEDEVSETQTYTGNFTDGADDITTLVGEYTEFDDFANVEKLDVTIDGVTRTVEKLNPTFNLTIDAGDAEVEQGSNITVTAELTYNDGNPMLNEDVVFSITGDDAENTGLEGADEDGTVTANTGSDGIATAQLNVAEDEEATGDIVVEASARENTPTATIDVLQALDPESLTIEAPAQTADFTSVGNLNISYDDTAEDPYTRSDDIDVTVTFENVDTDEVESAVVNLSSASNMLSEALVGQATITVGNNSGNINLENFSRFSDVADINKITVEALGETASVFNINPYTVTVNVLESDDATSIDGSTLTVYHEDLENGFNEYTTFNNGDTIDLVAGTYSYKIENDAYTTAEGTFTVAGDDTVNITMYKVDAAASTIELDAEDNVYTAGDDVILTLTVKDDQDTAQVIEELNGEYDAKVTFIDTSRFYNRSITFENGVATITVPAKEADYAGLDPVAYAEQDIQVEVYDLYTDPTTTFNNDGSASLTIEAADASELAITIGDDISGTTITFSNPTSDITAVDEFGNRVLEYDDSVKPATVTYNAAEAGALVAVDEEGNVNLNFDQGVHTEDLDLSELTGGSDIAVDDEITITTEDGISGTITVTAAMTVAAD